MVEHTSRLARDGLELRRLLNEFRFIYRIPIIFVSQNLRTDRDQDLAIIKLFNIVDEQYVEAIRIATRRGLEGVLKEGRWVSVAPYGYRLVGKGILEINEEEAKVVKEIFERYAKGEGIRSIVYDLNIRGVKPPKAKTWSQASISNIIQREIYKGVFVWGKYKYFVDPITGKKKKVPQNNTVVVPVPHLKIVDEYVWEKANQRLREQRRTAKRVRKMHPLYKIVRCGHCGEFMGKDGTKLTCLNYRNKKTCDNSIRLDYWFLYKWLIGNLKQYIVLNREKIEKIAKNLKTQEKDYQEELEKMKAKLENLMELYAENPSPYLKDKIKEYESKIERLEKLQKSKMAEFDFDKALENLEKVLKLDATEANKILKMFVDELIISENNGIIDLRIKTTAPLSTVVGIKEMGCPGLEPGTCGLRVRRSAD